MVNFMIWLVLVGGSEILVGSTVNDLSFIKQKITEWKLPQNVIDIIKQQETDFEEINSLNDQEIK